jgi:GNAT superfamily N-acetyltransferase
MVKYLQTPMIEYRLATEDDIDDLVSLRIIFLQEAEEIDSSKSTEELRKSLYDYFEDKLATGSFSSWLAVENGRIIATSGLSFHIVPPSFGNPSGEEAYLMNMYTLPKYRKKGIGGELLVKTLEGAKRRGIKKIRLHTTAIGKSLYEKRGFVNSNSEMILVLD